VEVAVAVNNEASLKVVEKIGAHPKDVPLNGMVVNEEACDGFVFLSFP